MVLGSIELMLLVIMLGTLLFTLFALIDIIRQPTSAWKATGHNQIVWLAIILVIPVLGSIVYIITVHRDLAKASHPSVVAMAR